MVMQSIRCPRCAKEVPEESVFCRRCGCALSHRGSGAPAMPPPVIPPLTPPVRTKSGGASVKVAPPPPPVVPPPPPTRVTPAKRPGAKKSGGGGGGIVVVLGVIAGVAFFSNKLKPKPVPPPTPVFNWSADRFKTSVELDNRLTNAMRATQQNVNDAAENISKAAAVINDAASKGNARFNVSGGFNTPIGGGSVTVTRPDFIFEPAISPPPPPALGPRLNIPPPWQNAKPTPTNNDHR
jgi:hypothetical protein